MNQNTKSTVHEGLTYAEIPGFRPLLLDLHVPTSDHAPPEPRRGVPLVVWIHGGGFLSGDRRYLPDTLPQGSVFDALTTLGIAVASIDYRFSGEALFPAQLDDVRAAIAFLYGNAARFGIDAQRTGLWGESAGGLLAALAALDERPPTGGKIGAVAVWYAPSDLHLLLSDEDEDHPAARLIGGTPARRPETATAASPARQVTPDAPPFLIMHGADDDRMPPEQGELLHTRLTAAGSPSAYIAVEGAGHCFAGHPNPLALVEQTAAFFGGRLTSPG